MLKDLYQAIRDDASPDIRIVKSERETCYFWPGSAEPIGVVEQYHYQAPEHSSLDSLLEYCRGNVVDFWIDSEQVTVVSQRELYCTFTPTWTDEAALLHDMAKLGGRSFTQYELIRTLKTKFAAQDSIDSLVAAVRRIDFKRTGAGHSVVEHGKESMGKSVEHEVQGREEIPEIVKIKHTIFTNKHLNDLTLSEVGIAIDVDQQKFGLFMPANAAKTMSDAAMQILHQAIKTNANGESWALYQGSPQLMVRTQLREP